MRSIIAVLIYSFPIILRSLGVGGEDQQELKNIVIFPKRAKSFLPKRKRNTASYWMMSFL